MSRLWKVSFFLVGMVLNHAVFAATGTGEAQAELATPLTVENTRDLNFGTIAIDPGAGSQTLELRFPQGVVCPASYVCSGTQDAGIIKISGNPNSLVNVSLSGSTATLSDGVGNTLVFDPMIITVNSIAVNADTYQMTLVPTVSFYVGGEITFDGSEVPGTYTSQNGSGYIVTVNY